MQDIFQDYMVNGNAANLLRFVADNIGEECLKVYRNNIFEVLRSSLEVVFPKIWLFLGTDCANSVAYAFIKKNLPTNACLEEWGGNFPSFLKCFKPLQHIQYLSDIASLEWLMQCSYIAKDQDDIKLDYFLTLSYKNPLKLSFQMMDSMFLYRSSHPISKLWELSITSDIENLNIGSEECFALVFRVDGKVWVHWLDYAMWRFLDALNCGNSIDACCDFISDFNDFNLIKVLEFIFNNKLLAKINYITD
ncbi:DNA-binding domain-containing protein [Candidatus Xenohaliotis californiensis]|uniref:HvfC/BufC N-terminal domain-containing protein n=1 Tax=Candidatus Xenohaliotis californiensis TaxID=84677 RepID=UPI0030C823E5